MMSEDGFHPSITTFIQDPNPNLTPNPNPNSSKRKRNLPGTPDPDAEVIALSPKSLMATNRFMCEICNKGFQRDQNLQLHRRGHNLPWKLKQRTNKEVKKKVYICPEKTCVHHDPTRALGDLTGIKKHFSRKHGEKKWKCEKCSKKYAVKSDWKAHGKICGTREYKCDCGTLFSRKDSFITHRAFCDALAEESARFAAPIGSPNLSFRNELVSMNMNNLQSSSVLVNGGVYQLSLDLQKPRLPLWMDGANPNPSNFMAAASMPELVQMAAAGNQWFENVNHGSSSSSAIRILKEEEESKGSLSEAVSSVYYSSNPPPQMSATALLQKAAQMGSTRATNPSSVFATGAFGLMSSSSFSAAAAELNCSTTNLESLIAPPPQGGSAVKQSQIDVDTGLTRDFLGVGGRNGNRQFLQENHELDKFAGIGFAVDMASGHYSRNH